MSRHDNTDDVRLELAEQVDALCIRGRGLLNQDETEKLVDWAMTRMGEAYAAGYAAGQGDEAMEETRGWKHVKPWPIMGILTEQWLFRPDRAPLCSLRRDTDDQWMASLLLKGGISASVLWLNHTLTLEEAKVASEDELRRMGWRWEATHVKSRG